MQPDVDQHVGQQIQQCYLQCGRVNEIWCGVWTVLVNIV